MKRVKTIDKSLASTDKIDAKETLCDKIERPIMKSLVTLGLIFMLIFWSTIPLIILSILGVSYQNMNSTMKVLITFFNDILLLIIFVSLYFKAIKRDFKSYFDNHFTDHFKKSFSTWLLGLGVMLVSNAIILILTNGSLSQNEQQVRELISSYPLYMAFQLMIYAPLTEEIIFRMSIKDIFPHHKKIYIFVSGFIFGFLHVITSLSQPLGFLYLVPYCALGFIFANLYYKTDNIFSTIMAHSIHNTLALFIYLRSIL